MKTKSIIALLLLIALSGISIQSDAQGAKYYALFMSKFTDYIKWPGTPSQIVIGVYGSKEVTKELEKFTSKKENIKIMNISSVENAQECQIIFLSKSKNSDFESLKSSVENKGVLLVTENDRFVEEGAGISFFMEGANLRFKLNKATIESHNLKISGSLLSLAVLV